MSEAALFVKCTYIAPLLLAAPLAETPGEAEGESPCALLLNDPVGDYTAICHFQIGRSGIEQVIQVKGKDAPAIHESLVEAQVD